MPFDDALGQLFLLSDDFSDQISSNFFSGLGGGGGFGAGGDFGGEGAEDFGPGPGAPGSGTIFDPNFQPETFFGELGGGEGGVQRDIGAVGGLGGGEGMVRFGGGFQTAAASRRNALRTVLKELGLPDPRTDPNAFTTEGGKRARFNERTGTFEASARIETFGDPSPPGGGRQGRAFITNIRTEAPEPLSQDEITELRAERDKRTRAAQILSPELLQVLQKTAQRGATSTEALTQNIRDSLKSAQALGPERFLDLQTAAGQISRRPGDFEANLAKLFLGEEQRQRKEARGEELRGEELARLQEEKEEGRVFAAGLREEQFARAKELAEIAAGRKAEAAEVKRRQTTDKAAVRTWASSQRAAGRARKKEDDAFDLVSFLSAVGDQENDLNSRVSEGTLTAADRRKLGIKVRPPAGEEQDGTKTKKPPSVIGGIRIAGAEEGRITAPATLRRSIAATAGTARQLLDRTLADTKGLDFNAIRKKVFETSFRGGPGSLDPKRIGGQPLKRVLFSAQEALETGNFIDEIVSDRGGTRNERAAGRDLMIRAGNFARRLAERVDPAQREEAIEILQSAIVDRLIQAFVRGRAPRAG